MGRFRRVLWLAVVLCVAVPAVSPPATAHPFHLVIDNSVLIVADSVFDSRWLAQSFVPTADFVVTRLALYVQDQGTSEVLSVKIRDCCVAGLPGSAVLTGGSVDGPPTPGWLDVDLLPSVLLSAGQTYWIVANNTGNNGNNGYDWWDSGDDLAYASGTGARSSDGISWSGMGKDYSFRVYGYSQPILGFSVSGSGPTVSPGQSLNYQVNFTNSGAGDSAALWVNVSLPPELNYTGDDAALIGGARSGTYTFSFTNVAPGSYSFNVTVRAVGGVDDGTVVQTQFRFEGTDHVGSPLSSSSTNLSVTMRNARLSLALSASAPDADPGDRLVLTAIVTNVGLETAMAVVVDATVDANATYVSSVPAGVYNGIARTVSWPATSLAPAASTSFAWTEDVAVGTADLSNVTGRAFVLYEDISGASLPSLEQSTITRVHSPMFAPLLQVDRSEAEAGEVLSAVLHYDNTGSTAAPRVWLNWSLGGHYALASLLPSVPFTPTTEGFSIEMTNVATGAHTIAAQLRVVRGLQDGLAMGLSVTVSATDGNGNLVPSTPLPAIVDLRAPDLSVTQGSAPARVAVDSLFVLSVTIENTGRATASTWLNLTLPSGVAYLADNGTFEVTSQGTRVSWRIPTLPSGSRIAIGITLRATVSGALSLRFALAFTDGAATPPVSVLSNSVAIEFFGGGPFGGGSWAWWLLLVLALVIPIAAVLAKYRAVIEEVFLVSHSGILLAHLSYSLKHERDRDVLAGMLTAVQDFIRDSFKASEEGALHSINFGQRKILVRRGVSSYLAVILKGRPSSRFARKMDQTLRKLELEYPQGTSHVDAATLDGASEVLSRELLGR